MAGRQGEDSEDMEGIETDLTEWRMRRLKRLRTRQGDSDSDREKCVFVVVRFENGGVKGMDPMRLTNVLKSQIGAIQNARVLEDGNLLIGCVSEDQVVKAGRLQCVGKAKVVKVARVGSEGCKGVIYGIPLTMQMGDLVKNLKEKCGAVLSATRLTRGAEKKETESVLIQFSTRETVTKITTYSNRLHIATSQTQPALW